MKIFSDTPTRYVLICILSQAQFDSTAVMRFNGTDSSAFTTEQRSIFKAAIVKLLEGTVDAVQSVKQVNITRVEQYQVGNRRLLPADENLSNEHHAVAKLRGRTDVTPSREMASTSLQHGSVALQIDFAIILLSPVTSVDELATTVGLSPFFLLFSLCFDCWLKCAFFRSRFIPSWSMHSTTRSPQLIMKRRQHHLIRFFQIPLLKWDFKL